MSVHNLYGCPNGLYMRAPLGFGDYLAFQGEPHLGTASALLVDAHCKHGLARLFPSMFTVACTAGLSVAGLDERPVPPRVIATAACFGISRVSTVCDCVRTKAAFVTA